MISTKDIDALLPQTQCGLCGFKGCMPYAEALSEKKAAINLCPPGGIKGLLALGELLNEDPSPFLEEMKQKEKPALRAYIREAECIGCTKCIKACPVDAILGASKSMHTVITDHCTGCELCIAPCPVDCIDLLPHVEETNELLLQEKRNSLRKRYHARESRLQKEDFAKSVSDKKQYLEDAIRRAAKKNP